MTYSVLANRYDGIDLPDNTCRILVFDGKPFSESLIDLHEEACRSMSATTLMRTLRTVEQGMGRSVRGEKDYSVVIIVGADITRLVRDQTSRKFLSPQTAAQIEIGLQIAEMAKAEIEDGTTVPEEAFNGLVRQCLVRDEGWKSFYVEQMAGIKPSGANERILRIYEAELKGEQSYQRGDYSAAVTELQKSMDQGIFDKQDKGWYLQEMARYYYKGNRSESQRLQIAAHNAHRLLFRPPDGVTVTKLTLVSQGRMERIISWVSQFAYSKACRYIRLVYCVDDY